MASRGGVSEGKGHDHDMFTYDSSAIGLGGGEGGGGGGWSGDDGLEDGLAKVLERGVGLDAAGFDDVSYAASYAHVYPFILY